MTKRDKRLLCAATAAFLVPHLIVWSWDTHAVKAAESAPQAVVGAVPAVTLAEALQVPVQEPEPWSIEDEDPLEDEKIEAALVEDVPLSYLEQDYLHTACDEFGVDYPLMLALIEHETNFQNVKGDNGRSAGYCQIQKKWWGGLMKEIGADDLNDPYDNFRTGCAIISQLMDKYGDIEAALTAYNVGHDNGSRTYARAVLAAAERWE